jgi:hypothetical protein
VIGGGLFLVRFMIQLFGGSDTDCRPRRWAMQTWTHIDADVSFKLLTLQGLTAFFMMFGLVGFAMLRESHASGGVALASASVARTGTVWLIGRIFSSVKSSSPALHGQTAAVGERERSI